MLLQKKYVEEDILSITVANNASYPFLFKFKKVIGMMKIDYKYRKPMI